MYIAVVTNARPGPANTRRWRVQAHFDKVKIAPLLMKFRHLCHNYVIGRIMIPT